MSFLYTVKLNLIYLLFMYICIIVNVSTLPINKVTVSSNFSNRAEHIRFGKISGLVGYDCEARGTQITPISLVTVKPCNGVARKPVTRTVKAQLIQRPLIDTIHVYSCHIAITRLAWDCGSSSHSSMVSRPLFSTILHVGPEKCRHMQELGDVDLGVYRKHSGLRPNTTSYIAIDLVASLSGHGRCTDEGAWDDGGGHYSEAAVSASIVITLSDIETTALRNEDKIQVEKFQLSCPFAKGYCKDTKLGEYYWSVINQGTCYEGEYDILYEGDLNITSYENSEGSIVQIASAETPSKTFVFKLKQQSHDCGMIIYYTEHSRVYIAINGQGVRYQGSTDLHPRNADLSMYVNAKFMFITHRIRGNLETMIEYVELKSCEILREIYINRLLLVEANPKKAGVLFNQAKGYTGRIMGEVIYTVECVPVPVKIRSTKECYQALPVEHIGQNKFLDPITHVLTRLGVEIDCTPAMVSHYYLNDQWMSRSPGMALSPAPTELDPNREKIELDLGYTFTAGHLGIYTIAQLEAMNKEMMFSSTRDAIEANMIRAIHVDNNGRTSYSGLWGASEINAITDSVASKLSWFFRMFGQWASVIIAIVVLYKILAYILETIVNCCVLKKSNVSWWKYPMGLFTSLTHALVGSWGPKKKSITAEIQDTSTSPRVKPRIPQKPKTRTSVETTVELNDLMERAQNRIAIASAPTQDAIIRPLIPVP